MTNWKINLIEGTPSGWAVTLHYTASLTDGDDTVRSNGTVTMPAQEDGMTFTDIQAMGKDAAYDYAVHWVKEQLGADTVAEIEANLTARMADKKNPPVVDLFSSREVE